jgi:quercetin dioxygenase-like cupin family protein
MCEVVLHQPGEGETMFDTPERTIRVLADRAELALTLFRLAPGQDGPEPHIHRQHTDAFYVVEGELEVALGPDLEPLTASAGALAAAPPGVVHTFRNAGAQTTVFLNIHAPSMGFPEMLREAREGRDDPAHFDQFEPPADGGRPQSDALFSGPGQGETADGGRQVLLKARTADFGGSLALAETTLSPAFEGRLREGPLDVKSVYILEGTLSVRVADDWLEARAGACVVCGGGATTFANRSEAPCSSVVLFAPPVRP